MNKHVITQNIKILPLIFLFIVIFIGCSSNKFEITDTKANSDLIGTKLGLLTTISEDNLKSLKVTDKTIDGKNAKVIVSVEIEYTDKGKGILNKYYIHNDIEHKISGNITLNYAQYDKDWRLEDVTNIEQLKEEKKEVETSIEAIPFKSEKEVYENLKNNNVGIQISDGIGATLTLGENKTMGYKTVKEVKEFKILNVESDKNSVIYNFVTIYLDANFEVNDKNNLYKKNGNYNAKGQFIAMYRLEQDEQGNPIWNFSSIKSFTPKFEITKI